MQDEQRLKSMKLAKETRTPGSTAFKSVGGRHGSVKAYSKQFEAESNHTPPKDVYKGSPYSLIVEDDMPAMSMLFYHHRNPSSKSATVSKELDGPSFLLGGASSTGGSGVNKGWGAELSVYMMNGEFYKAMAQDIKDILNTVHPNYALYQEALGQAAMYARKFFFTRSDNGNKETLIKDDNELGEVLRAIFSRG